MLNTVAQSEKKDQGRLPGLAQANAISKVQESQKMPGIEYSRDPRKIVITKEVFMLFMDFMETRKMAGHMAIEFSDGDITSVEGIAKKRYK